MRLWAIWRTQVSVSMGFRASNATHITRGCDVRQFRFSAQKTKILGWPMPPRPEGRFNFEWLLGLFHMFRCGRKLIRSCSMSVFRAVSGTMHPS